MRGNRSQKRESNPTFAVVVDGNTEVWYLQMLKRNERNIRVNIKPEIPSKKSLKEQYEMMCDLCDKEFTKVFWIVDLDSIIKEEKEGLKNKTSPLKFFEKYQENLSRNYPNARVIVNNPCLEFWFLLHFEKTSKYFKACSNAETQLKKHLPKYQKTQKFFTKQNDDIYLKLKPFLKTALANSISLGEFDKENPTKAMCEMEMFFLTEEFKKYYT